jgi:hypothetical protein
LSQSPTTPKFCTEPLIPTPFRLIKEVTVTFTHLCPAPPVGMRARLPRLASHENYLSRYGGCFFDQLLLLAYDPLAPDGSLSPLLKTEAHSGKGNWCSKFQCSAAVCTVHSKRLTLKVIPWAAPKVGSFIRADRSSARSTILMCGSQFWVL